jgi:putative membrane protein
MQANDTLANERTYLAYVRTALAFIAFGFVVARFSLFAREFALIVHGSVTAPGESTGFGIAMALFGVYIALLGAWRYSTTDHGLRQGRVITMSSAMGYAISLFVLVVGAIVAMALLAQR